MATQGFPEDDTRDKLSAVPAGVEWVAAKKPQTPLLRVFFILSVCSPREGKTKYHRFISKPFAEGKQSPWHFYLSSLVEGGEEASNAGDFPWPEISTAPSSARQHSEPGMASESAVTNSSRPRDGIYIFFKIYKKWIWKAKNSPGAGVMIKMIK